MPHTGEARTDLGDEDVDVALLVHDSLEPLALGLHIKLAYKTRFRRPITTRPRQGAAGPCSLELEGRATRQPRNKAREHEPNMTKEHHGGGGGRQLQDA